MCAPGLLGSLAIILCMYVRGYRFSALSPQPYLSNLLEIRGAVAVAILSAARARAQTKEGSSFYGYFSAITTQGCIEK